MDIAAAIRAIRALIEDPDDTAQVFRIIRALSNDTVGSLMKRMRSSPRGQALLSEQPMLIDRLRDHDGLAALPEGTLGNAYLHFCDKAKIHADGLVEASEEGGAEEAVSQELQWLGDRMRDTHDLWHVTLGYDSDIIGEASILAFTFAQTWNRGVGLIVAVALVRLYGQPELRRVIMDAFWRGRRSAWLPEQAWEQLLDEPLEDVRHKLGVGAPPHYERVFSSDLAAHFGAS